MGEKDGKETGGEGVMYSTVELEMLLRQAGAGPEEIKEGLELLKPPEKKEARGSEEVMWNE